MNTTEIINLLSQQYIQNIKAKEDKPSLLLIGFNKSPFLRSVNRLAQEVGMDAYILSYLPRLIGDCKVVVDRETCDTVTNLPAEADVDNLYNPGLSCVAEAAYEVLSNCFALDGKVVTIVGRGHAVQGLAEKLIALNATVTIAHSHTEDIGLAMKNTDIVVLATPVVKAIPDAKELVLDIGDAMSPDMVDALRPGCQYESHIGKLTNAILLARVAGVQRES